MPNPLSVDSDSIDEILRSRDAFTVNRLFDAYRCAGNGDAFVAALIARLLLEIDRSALHGKTS